MKYALLTIWFERRRYFAGILAVGFSALLIAVQVGLLLGLIGVVTVPIVNSSADVWVMFPGTPSCDLGRPIPAYWLDRIWSQPGVVRAETFLQNFSYLKTSAGASELIVILGVNLDDQSLGPVAQLSPEQRAKLTEPNAVICDRKDATRLGLVNINDEAEISGQRVRCIGHVSDMAGLAGPYVVASIPTARSLLKFREDQATYLLTKCDSAESAKQLCATINAGGKMTARLSDDWAVQSKMHWVQKTKVGLAIGFAALLGLAVGASITSQTLYAAINSSIRELAVLRALGIPRWRMSLFVVQQSLVIGIFGLLAAYPIAYGLIQLVRKLGTKAELPVWLLLISGGVTLSMAVLAGLMSLRSLRSAEPATLLR